MSDIYVVSVLAGDEIMSSIVGDVSSYAEALGEFLFSKVPLQKPCSHFHVFKLTQHELDGISKLINNQQRQPVAEIEGE